MRQGGSGGSGTRIRVQKIALQNRRISMIKLQRHCTSGQTSSRFHPNLFHQLRYHELSGPHQISRSTLPQPLMKVVPLANAAEFGTELFKTFLQWNVTEYLTTSLRNNVKSKGLVETCRRLVSAALRIAKNLKRRKRE